MRADEIKTLLERSCLSDRRYAIRLYFWHLASGGMSLPKHPAQLAKIVGCKVQQWHIASRVALPLANAVIADEALRDALARSLTENPDA